MNKRNVIEEIVKEVIIKLVDLDANGIKYSKDLSFDYELEEAGVDTIIEVVNGIFSCDIGCNGRIGSMIDTIEERWNGNLPQYPPEEYFDTTNLEKIFAKWEGLKAG